MGGAFWAGRLARTVAVAALLAQAGCGGWKDEAIEAGRSRDAAAQKNRRALIQKRIEDVGAEIDRDPLSLAGNKTEIEKVSEEAQNLGVFAEFETKLAELKKKAETAFEEGAADAAKKGIEKARGLAKDGKFKEARRELDGLKVRIGATPAWKSCEEALANIAQRERADALFARNKARAETFRERGEPERARGVLEAFLALADAIPAFRESPRVKEVEDAVKALEPEVAKAVEARKSEAAIKWQPAFTGREEDLFKWDLDRPDCANVNSEKVCVFKYDDGGDPTTYMTFPREGAGDEWEDYIVTAKALIPKDSKKIFFFGHGEMIEEDGEPTRHWRDYAEITPWESKVERGKWVDLRLEVRGGTLTLLCDGVSIVSKSCKLKKGPFQIRVERGGEIHLREVWVKVYKPAP